MRGSLAALMAATLLLAACSGQQSTPGATPASTAPPSVVESSRLPEPVRDRTASVVASGDLLWHDSVWWSAQAEAKAGQKYNFDPMFAALKPMISAADMAICHAEVPFAPQGEQPTNYPMFGAPREIASWIPTMGWDACTTDSNHSLDRGIAGLEQSVDLYRKNNVLVAGTYKSAAERNEPVIFTTKAGVKIGIVSGTYGLNGLQLPAGKEHAVSILDAKAKTLLADAKRTREAGADIVMAHVHAGDEYVVQPSAQQSELAEALTASPDVDIVFGEHVHVVQPITKVNGKWVIYGVGNMVAQHLTSVPAGYEGITVQVDFAEKQGGGFDVSKVTYVPTYWTHYARGGAPLRMYRVNDALKSKTGDQARLKAALERTRAAVNALGKTPGVEEG